MRNHFSKLALTAILALAITLTLSCSDDKDDGGGEQSYKYCVTANNTCLTGPFTASTCTGQLSNSCPDGSDPIGGGSSSSGGGDKGNTFKDDRDGKSYKWVKIGNQTWMAENLNYDAPGSKCYGEGGMVYNRETTECDITLSNSEVKANCIQYGRLYDWSTAKSACPDGWHLPSKEEWDVLATYIENDKGCTNCAGKHLKARSGWNSNGNGEDTYGFSALPGGYYDDPDGCFVSVERYGHWWSRSEYDSDDAYRRLMGYGSEGAKWDNRIKSYLFSVRCLKD